MKTKAEAEKAAKRIFKKQVRKGYQVTAVYEYKDKDGNPVYWRVRLDHTNGDKYIRPLSYMDGEWVLKEPEFKNCKPLYRLLGVLLEPESDVWVVEGEKCADLLAELGLVTVTSGSSSSAGTADWSSLSNRRVIIWPDNDASGMKYAKAVTEQLTKIGCKVEWVDLSKIKYGDDADGGDAVDWKLLYPEATKVDVEALPVAEPELYEKENIVTSSQQGNNQSQLLDQIAASCELFHSPDKQAYVTVPINSHYETWLIGSSGFIDWLAGTIFSLQGSIPRVQVINDFVSTLIGRAKYQGEEHPVHIRLAQVDDVIYLDLAGKKSDAIKITPDGWSLITNPPVKFIRPNGMLTLSKPNRGGSLDDLAKLINLSNEDDLKLLVCCLSYYLNPAGPFPIIIIQGEQGSAKSTFSRLIKTLIDPSSVPLRSAPRNERDLMISAQNGWLLVFDNLSKISQDMSDALCRLSTGGGVSTRSLYTNTEETILQATRPICLNGITEFATKPDLLDRALIFKLSPIPKHLRKEERVFWAEFEEAAPKILGLLLDGVSTAFRNLTKVKLDDLPRMADFARFATASEESFGWPTGSFMEAYYKNQEIGLDASLESDPVAQAVLDWDVESWLGTATELLEKLEQYAPDSTIRSQFWPKTPSALSSKLRRLASSLRKAGISVAFEKDGRAETRRRVISIKRVEQSPSPASPSSDIDTEIPF